MKIQILKFKQHEGQIEDYYGGFEIGRIDLPMDGKCRMYLLEPTDPEEIYDYGKVAFVSEEIIAKTKEGEPLLIGMMTDDLLTHKIDFDSIEPSYGRELAKNKALRAIETFGQLKNVSHSVIENLFDKYFDNPVLYKISEHLQDNIFNQLLDFCKEVWGDCLNAF